MQTRQFKYAFHVSIVYQQGMNVSRMSTSSSDDWRSFLIETVEAVVKRNSHCGQLPEEVAYSVFSAEGNTTSGTLTYNGFLHFSTHTKEPRKMTVVYHDDGSWTIYYASGAIKHFPAGS